VRSKLTSKGFSIDDASSNATKSSTSDVTSEDLTTASQPTRVQSLTETKTVDNFMHDTDHVLLMSQDISGSRDVVGTDNSFTNNRSLSTRGLSAGGSTGNIITRRDNFDNEDPVSIDTRLEYRRSGVTTDSASTNLHGSSSGVLDLESTGEVVHDGRDKLVLNVVNHRARATEETVVSVGFEVRVTGEGSSSVVVTIRVEVFFNVNDFRFLMILFIVGTLVFETVVEGQETHEDDRS